MKGKILFSTFFIIISVNGNARAQGFFSLLDDEVFGRYKSQRSVAKPLGEKNTTLPIFKKKSTSPPTARMSNGIDSFDNIPPLGNSGHEVSCRGISKRINMMGKEAMCRPRKTLVKLDSDFSYMYVPDTVIVDRCEGMCGHHSQSCMPIESIFKKVHVKKIERRTWSSPVCWELKVEEHTRCKCDCDLMATDCNKRQRYNPDACRCECDNVEEKMTCDSKEDMDWNPETCRCNCRVEEEICNTKLVWVPSMCKCLQVMDNNLP